MLHSFAYNTTDLLKSWPQLRKCQAVGLTISVRPFETKRVTVSTYTLSRENG